jgi:hypothetical protein
MKKYVLSTIQMMKKVFLLLTMAISFVANSQITTQKLIAGQADQNANSFVYALPMVKFKVDVWVEKTDHLRGPYASFADELLGISDVTEYNSSTYKIKNVSLTAVYVPDPNQIYAIQLDGLSGKSEISKYISVSETGLLAGISPISANEEIENKIVVEKVIEGSREFSYYADANLVEKVDTILRRVDIDTATIEKVTLKRYSVEKDLATRAQDAATFLMQIRNNRFQLISGYSEVPYTADALLLMNSELKELEKDYMALFTGKKLVTDQHHILYYTPKENESSVISPIFKFSKETGLNFLLDGGGESVNIAIKSSGLSDKLSDISTSSVVKGVVYRMPETAEIWVKYGEQEFDKQILTIPQLGKLQSIPLKESSFELYPSTGGLKMLEIKE